MTNKSLEESSDPMTKAAKSHSTQGYKYLVLGGLTLFVGGIALGYSVGHRQGLTAAGYSADAEELMGVVQKQKDTLSALNKSANIATQERDVAVNNTSYLTHALTENKADLSIAQTQNQIYRNTLKQRGGIGLTVQNLSVRPITEDAYEYQLDLLQVSPSQRPAVGTVELRLIRSDETLVIPMQDNHFNFENFERLTGRWTMPKGFVPQFIEVRVNGGLTEIKRFNWLRGQPISTPPAFVSDVPQAEAKTQ